MFLLIPDFISLISGVEQQTVVAACFFFFQINTQKKKDILIAVNDWKQSGKYAA